MKRIQRKYIDANKVENIVEELENMCINAPQYVLDKLAELKNLPPEDVSLVVHSKWMQVDDTKCRCPKCEVITLIAQYPHGDKNYCPNCGAKMDIL